MIGWMTPRARTVGRISEMSGGFLPWRILALLTDSLSKGMKSSFMALVLLGWTGSEIIIVLESRLMPSEPVFRAGRARASSASRRKLVVSIIGGGTRAIEAAGGRGAGTGLAPRTRPDRKRPVARNTAGPLAGGAHRATQSEAH